MVSKGILAFLLCGVIALSAIAQEDNYDSLLAYYLKSDSLYLNQLEQDMNGSSMDILDLMDSLLNTDFRYSQLSLRTGYTSEITYANRNIGFQQHGFNTGVSYYHKSGIFADVSSYWKNDISNEYSPTIMSLGYFGGFTNKWNYSMSFDKYVYPYVEDKNDLVYSPITSSINASSFFDIGKFTLSGDYSLLFTDENMHRIHGNLIYSLTAKNVGFIDRIVFMPTISAQLGNSQITKTTSTFPSDNLEMRYKIRQYLFEQYGEQLIKYLFINNREKYLELELKAAEENRDVFTEYSATSENAFGLMNYSISAPVYLYVNSFTFSLNFHYNIPVALPGESLILEPNSYIGANLIYNIPLN